MKYLVLFALLVFGNVAYAQKQSVLIKTSAQCGMCKERIEKSLSKNKGIDKVSLNMDTKALEVTYNAKKTNEAKIRTAVSNIGYDADHINRNPKAHDNLPDCCKSEVKTQKEKKAGCCSGGAKKECKSGI